MPIGQDSAEGAVRCGIADDDDRSRRAGTEDCKACPFFAACPMQKKGSKFEMSYTDKSRFHRDRLEERRREQQTKPFQERYAKRSGMESTNPGAPGLEASAGPG